MDEFCEDEESEYSSFADDPDNHYDIWRDDCCMSFDEDLNDFINSYRSKKNNYMSNLGHLIQGLECKLEALKKEEAERLKKARGL